MDKLTVGMTIDIMRSDGRVHGAIITELYTTHEAVAVEWFEKVCFGGNCVMHNSNIGRL
jgi:hypothetical protein